MCLRQLTNCQICGFKGVLCKQPNHRLMFQKKIVVDVDGKIDAMLFTNKIRFSNRAF